MDNLNEKPTHKPPLGMRAIKTIVASFACMLVDYLRGEIPFQSVVTTAMCIQPNREESVTSSIARAGGTIVGAIFAMLYLGIRHLLNIPPYSILDYFAATLMFFPMLFAVIKLRFAKGVAVSIIVFMSISMTHNTAMASWSYAFKRVIDTFVGIFVALPVNLLLPGTGKGGKSDKLDNFSNQPKAE